MTLAIPIIALRMPWKFEYHTAPENRHKTFFSNRFFGACFQNLCFLSPLTAEPLVIILLSGPLPFQFVRHKSIILPFDALYPRY
jgi:hypothetical protein